MTILVYRIEVKTDKTDADLLTLKSRVMATLEELRNEGLPVTVEFEDGYDAGTQFVRCEHGNTTPGDKYCPDCGQGIFSGAL